jgi:hypothetical protein
MLAKDRLLGEYFLLPAAESQGSTGQQRKLDQANEIEDGTEQGIGPRHLIATQIEGAAHHLHG